MQQPTESRAFLRSVAFWRRDFRGIALTVSAVCYTAEARSVRRHGDIAINWEAIGAAGEVVGAAGVVATLVYLSVQIRRSTAQAKSDSFIKVNELSQGLGMKLADDLEFTKHVLMASEDWGSVSPERQFQAHMWNLVEAQLYETYYFMMLNGQITEETYHSREGHIARRLLSPGTRYWWENFTYSLDPRFVERINARLQSPSTLPPIADVAFFDSSKWNIRDA